MKLFKKQPLWAFGGLLALAITPAYAQGINAPSAAINHSATATTANRTPVDCKIDSLNPACTHSASSTASGTVTPTITPTPSPVPNQGSIGSNPANSTANPMLTTPGVGTITTPPANTIGTTTPNVGLSTGTTGSVNTGAGTSVRAGTAGTAAR